MAPSARRQTDCCSKMWSELNGFCTHVSVAGNKLARASKRATGLPRHIGRQSLHGRLAISNNPRRLFPGPYSLPFEAHRPTAASETIVAGFTGVLPRPYFIP